MPRNSRARTQVRQMRYPEHMHKLAPPAGTRSMCLLRFCALRLASALGVGQTLVWVQQHCSLPWIHGQHQLSSCALCLAHSVISESSSRAWFIISCCQRLVSSPACMITSDNRVLCTYPSKLSPAIWTVTAYFEILLIFKFELKIILLS